MTDILVGAEGPGEPGEAGGAGMRQSQSNSHSQPLGRYRAPGGSGAGGEGEAAADGRRNNGGHQGEGGRHPGVQLVGVRYASHHILHVLLAWDWD